MIPLPRRRYQSGLLLAFVLLALASLVGSPFPRDQLVQHVPTAIAVVCLLAITRRVGLTDFSFTLVVVFLALHALGARYIYSYVPYDRWASAVFGATITETFGLRRNHYDRLVHLSFGLLLTIPIHEVVTRVIAPPRVWGYVLAVALNMVGSVLYELGEALVALTFAPDWADRYLGQQGDPWDSHRDMALATAGAVVAATAKALWPYRFRRS